MSAADPIVFLSGKNVILRPVSKSDVPHLVRWINDPEIRNFLATCLPMTEEGEEAWVENIVKNRNETIVLIIETKDGKPIGTMGTTKINWIDRVCTTGAMIGEREYWGKGLGSEAKMLLLEYLFNTLNMWKVCSQVIAYNKRSISYSKKCGYKFEGIRKKHTFRKGRYWDIVELAIFADDFRKEQGNLRKVQTPLRNRRK